jgi:hypothetical protein
MILDNLHQRKFTRSTLYVVFVLNIVRVKFSCVDPLLKCEVGNTVIGFRYIVGSKQYLLYHIQY